MKIAIVNNQVPFVYGGAEFLADWLRERLLAVRPLLRDSAHSVQVESTSQYCRSYACCKAD